MVKRCEVWFSGRWTFGSMLGGGGVGAGHLGWVLCKGGGIIHLHTPTHPHSLYRAVNTLHLGYTNQSVNVVQGNNRCLF